MVNPSVASASEGAAPNNPAKRRGRNKSLTSANADTKCRPLRIAAEALSRSLPRFATSGFHAFAKATPRRLWSLQPQDFVFLPDQLVIINEEILQLARKFFP